MDGVEGPSGTRRLSLYAATVAFNPIGTRLELRAKSTLRPMAYIVDGNNVIGQTPGWHRDKPGSRRSLLEKLAVFTRAKKARLTVVFDGAPDTSFPDGSAFKGVKVLYAEQGSDADTRILRLVEASHDPRGITVVTSDRHLAFLVRSLGAAVVRSGEFRAQMERAIESNPRQKVDEEVESDDLNSWLRYFGSLPEDDDVAEN